MIDKTSSLTTYIFNYLELDRDEWVILRRCVSFANLDPKNIIISNMSYSLYKVVSNTGKIVYRVGLNIKSDEIGYVIFRRQDYDNLNDLRKDFITSTYHVCMYESETKTLNTLCRIKPYPYYCENLDKMKNICAKLKSPGIKNINFLLHGLPGTGKSLVASSLGYYIKYNVIIAEPGSIMKMIKSVELSKHIVIINEIDKSMTEDGEFIDNELYKNLLEFLDGSLTPKSCVIILICNDFSKLMKNKIITRSGRVHFVLAFNLLQAEQIIPTIRLYYSPTPEQESALIEKFKPFYNKISPSDFTNFIKKKFIYNVSLDELLNAKYSKSDFIMNFSNESSSIYL